MANKKLEIMVWLYLLLSQWQELAREAGREAERELVKLVMFSNTCSRM
jgi:hypothetical protein